MDGIYLILKPYLKVIIGVVIGVLGFFASKFWMQPILLYREIKSKILGRIIYFSDVYKDDSFEYLKKKSKVDPEIKEVVEKEKARMTEKQLEYRKLAGELFGVITYLPKWYRFYLLKIRKENPWKAKDELIGLSNSIEYKDDQIRKYSIKVFLKVPGWKNLKKPNQTF